MLSHRWRLQVIAGRESRSIPQK